MFPTQTARQDVLKNSILEANAIESPCHGSFMDQIGSLPQWYEAGEIHNPVLALK
jgi:hypothetical protein